MAINRRCGYDTGHKEVRLLLGGVVILKEVWLLTGKGCVAISRRCGYYLEEDGVCHGLGSQERQRKMYMRV